MANDLDETDMSLVNEQGREVHVIEKKLPVTLDGTDKFVNVAVWFLLIIGGVVYTFRKAKAKTYFQQLEQKLQHDASTVDNFMEQRVMILQNAAKLVEKSIALDKETFTEIARLRSGNNADTQEVRDQIETKLNTVEKSLNFALENYPDLKAHADIANAMQQNAYLQKEITAAREAYNDTVKVWNAQIFTRWAKRNVAAKQGYTTRIPYSTSTAIKEQAKGVFF